MPKSQSIQILPGINVQWPWSQLLLRGEKTIETRGYPIPEKYKGVPLAMIETPGRHGAKAGVVKAKIIAVVTFSGCKKYVSKEDWLDDCDDHCVRPDDPLYAYREGEAKWAWIVKSVRAVSDETSPPSPRGIVFASGCRVEM
jgi:hypothetical protein